MSTWDFLLQPAGFDIGETGLLAFEATQPVWRALLVGLGNTLRVSLPALLLATVLGLLLALGRGSSSRSWRLLSSVVVDTVRLVPLLLQLLIWYLLLVEWLPDANAALSLLPGVWLSKGGLAFPWPAMGDGGWAWSWPVQEAFNVQGGGAVTPEFLAVMLALSVYTGAFLAEVFRSGIEAVSASLLEAAETLGATRWQVIRRVLLPQALRTILPATTNQYLNLVKNSSLAVAVGYPDLVSVGNTTLNQTGRAVECVAVMMALYLAMSLLTSAAMNAFNARQAAQGGQA
ncbi:ABC transporter permease subunit [Aquabacterium sp.]|uniref:ABC transporter permease subunit n=1 Tax=Aquabacterium sp. TaxID=1872578 RepID=UPI001D793E35|nr:ABC transporter permease subunit [Aquabacterium sp.]MBT9610983.1 ABC transporter permease subunit [Aquabacterium sp.]